MCTRRLGILRSRLGMSMFRLGMVRLCLRFCVALLSFSCGLRREADFYDYGHALVGRVVNISNVTIGQYPCFFRSSCLCSKLTIGLLRGQVISSFSCKSASPMYVSYFLLEPSFFRHYTDIFTLHTQLTGLLSNATSALAGIGT